MSGILYGIGTGPGDPELMTIKAKKILQRTEVIAIPSEDENRCLAYRTAGKLLPEIGEKTLLRLSFPMTGDPEILREHHRKNADVLKRYLDAGKDVAFLTIGDPSIYSTYGYMHRILTAEGYTARMISGVPSFCAAAASLGEILCEGGETLKIVPSVYLTDEISAAFAPDGQTDCGQAAQMQNDCTPDGSAPHGRPAQEKSNCTPDGPTDNGRAAQMQSGRTPSSSAPHGRPAQSLLGKGSTVFMKPAGMEKLLPALEASGRRLFMVQNCSMPEEQIFRGAGQFPQKPGYLSIVIAAPPSQSGEADVSADRSEGLSAVPHSGRSEERPAVICSGKSEERPAVICSGRPALKNDGGDVTDE